MNMDFKKVPCLKYFLFLLEKPYILCMIFALHLKFMYIYFVSQFDLHKHLFW